MSQQKGGPRFWLVVVILEESSHSLFDSEVFFIDYIATSYSESSCANDA